jgi:hypothetical protein
MRSLWRNVRYAKPNGGSGHLAFSLLSGLRPLPCHRPVVPGLIVYFSFL